MDFEINLEWPTKFHNPGLWIFFNGYGFGFKFILTHWSQHITRTTRNVLRLTVKILPHCYNLSYNFFCSVFRTHIVLIHTTTFYSNILSIFIIGMLCCYYMWQF